MPAYPPHGAPAIAPVPPGVERPFWSVMIPVYSRVTWLEQAVRSVLAEFTPGEMVQVEIVDDASPQEPDIAGLIARIGDRRVSLHRNPSRLGMVNNWNRCIERSRGTWVHLLHDDDYVLPGFYAAHRAAGASNPSIGFAASGAGLLEHETVLPWKPLLQSPGVAPEWTRWLIFCNWLLMPSVVVKRESYEAVGGFHPRLEHAVDWEMWMRLASRFALWLDPAVRAVYRKHETSETQRQVQSGSNVADIRCALDVARGYLPETQADALVGLSREAWACGVMNGVRQFLRRGEMVTALAQFREAMNLAMTPKVIREIEGGVMHCFDEYRGEVENALTALHAGSADDSLLWQLKDARRRLCRQWLALPHDMLHAHYDGDLGRLHKLLMESGLPKAPLDDQDKSLLESLAMLDTTPDHAGLVRSLYFPQR